MIRFCGFETQGEPNKMPTKGSVVSSGKRCTGRAATVLQFVSVHMDTAPYWLSAILHSELSNTLRDMFRYGMRYDTAIDRYFCSFRAVISFVMVVIPQPRAYAREVLVVAVVRE